MQNISIPRNVTRVGDDLCWSCTSLKWATILYDLDPETGDKLMPETEPGNNRVYIGNGAFQNCESLEYAYIGNNVFFLNDGCFSNTPNLKEIYVNNVTPPGMYEGDHPFTSYDATLYVPKAAIETYRTNKYWKFFTKILPLEKEGSSVENFFKDADQREVTVDKGTITINDTECQATIVDLSGRTIYIGKGGSVNVPNGLYLVTIGSETVKVWVR